MTTDRPPGPLIEFVLSFLAPLLMAGGLTDLTLARLAAAEAVAAYQTEGRNQLITISQILAFALTALDNLRLSMPQDLSLSMKLKLRGNANALNRSARDNTQTLEKARFTPEPGIAEQAATAYWQDPEPPAAADPATDPAPAETPIPTPTQQQNNLHWAKAMQKQASTLQAANLPPAQQKAAGLWINALNDVANDLIHAKAPARPPA